MTEMPSTADGIPPAATAPPVGPLLAAAFKRYQDVQALLAQGQADHEAALTDVEFVHDLRVASRRLGEVVRLLRQFLDKPTGKAVVASVRALRRAVGDLRDLDVTRQHLLKWRMPRPLKAHARLLAEELAGRRPILATAGRQHMASASLSGTMLILARVLEELQQPDNAPAAEATLEAAALQHARERHSQLRRAFGRAARKQTPEALHAARIAVKKLRYVLELLQDFRRGLKRQIRELKRLQQLLGDHHDVHVIVAALAEHLRRQDEKDATRRRRLQVAWRRWQRAMQRAQAKRAAMFFLKSYHWLNSTQSTGDCPQKRDGGPRKTRG